MLNEWIYPTVVTQFCEADVHVPWINIDQDFTQINLVRSQRDLRHIANPLVNDIKMKTYFLVLKGFEFINLPDVITGIEAYIDIRRTGRITDETIQLYRNGPLGGNLGTGKLDNLQTYGGANSLWGLESISPNILDEEFGLVLRYQSHPNWPHQTTPNMEHVQIRVW
jgi:hypothetical protein